jgi:Arm domain-containing DNA-binding protein/integrase-like protein
MLTDLAIRNAKPKEKPYKLTDGKGMYLLVNQAGKYWRMDYRFNGKRKTLALGVYPNVGLEEARERCDEARKQWRTGVDPGEARKAMKARRARGDSFEKLIREWVDRRGWSPRYTASVLALLERELFPRLGHRSIAEIETQELIEALKAVAAKDKGGAFEAVSGVVREWIDQLKAAAR